MTRDGKKQVDGKWSGNEKRRLSGNMIVLIDHLKATGRATTDADASELLAGLIQSAYGGSDDVVHPAVLAFGGLERRLHQVEVPDFANLTQLLGSLFVKCQREAASRPEKVEAVRRILIAQITGASA